MADWAVVAVPCGLLVMLLAIGTPVAFSLLIAGAVGLYVAADPTALRGILAVSPFTTAASYEWSLIPLFILMAFLASESGIMEGAFKAANIWVGRLPGGVAIATCVGSGIFGTACGSSTAAASTLSGIAIPEMKRYGYDDRLATGCVAAAGTFAIMIPPSLAFIIYGIITETPVGYLFMAGIVPGSLTVVMYAALIWIMVKRRPSIAPLLSTRPSWREKLVSIKAIFPFLVIIGLVLVTIYLGIITPTEAGAIGAFGTFILALAMRRLSVSGLKTCLIQTLRTSVMIFWIIIGAMIFGYFMSVTLVIPKMIQFVGALPVSSGQILSVLLVMYLVLGCFMDQAAILLLTLPLSFPLVVHALGYDPIWFGVIIVKTVEIGLLTPPVGLNAYVVSGASNVPLGRVFAGLVPFLLLEIVCLTLLVIFPEISLWLPARMAQ